MNMKFIKVIILTLLLGCNIGNERTNIHPNNKNIYDSEEENLNIINFTYNKKSNVFLQNLNFNANIFQNFKKQIIVGEEEIKFGLIKDVEVDSLGRIYYLDQKKQLVNVFDSSGRFLTTIGNEGRGPGELESAKSINIYKNKWLLISNGYRVEVFNISEKQISFLKTVRFEKSIRSLCTIGDRLYISKSQVLDPRNRKNVEESQVYTMQVFELPNFTYLNEFGEPYKDSTPMVVDRLSAGNVSCNKNNSTILYTFEKMPIIHGYSSDDNSLQWKTRIDNLHFTRIIENKNTDNPSLTYEIPGSGILDRVLDPITLSDNFEFFQVDRRITSKEDKYSSTSKVFSFIIDVTNGNGKLVAEDIPRTLAITPEMYVGASEFYITSTIYKRN